MNIVFFMGKEIEEGTFKFILNKKVKHKSQYTFKFQLPDESIIDMVAYDEIADYIVQNKPMNMIIQGNLKSEKEKIQVEIEECYGEKY